MLLLLFQIEENRFGVEAERVLEITPMAELYRPPQAPPAIAGILDYRGIPVPVVDMSRLFSGSPAALRLSTRIILVRYDTPQGEPRTLGILAEKATETLFYAQEDFHDAGVALEELPCLGEIRLAGGERIQKVRVEKLLPDDVRAMLFSDQESK